MLARTDTENLLREMLPARAEAILALARPAIELLPTEQPGEPERTGGSRYGGRPDLPDDIAWPLAGSEPLLFLAQLDFAELAPHDRGGRLPNDGMVWFFTDGDSAMGATPPGGEEWQVFYRAGTPALKRRQPPPAEIWLGEPIYPEILPNLALGFRPFLSLPGMLSPRYAPLKLTEPERDALFAVQDAMSGAEPLPTCHKVLGYPEPAQGEVEECLSGGLPFRERPRDDDPSHLQLLLQIDSVFDIASTRFCWGDAGKLYFMLHEQDLAARRFDRTMFAMQCG